MQRVIMKSEMNHATMRRAALDFDGSYGVSPAFMRAADIVVTSRIVRIGAANRVVEQAAIA